MPNVYNLRNGDILSLLAMHNLTTQIQKDLEAAQKRLQTFNLKQDRSDYFAKGLTVNDKSDLLLQNIVMLVNDVNYLVDILLEKEQNCTNLEVANLSEIKNMSQTTDLTLTSNISEANLEQYFTAEEKMIMNTITMLKKLTMTYRKRFIIIQNGLLYNDLQACG